MLSTLHLLPRIKKMGIKYEFIGDMKVQAALLGEYFTITMCFPFFFIPCIFFGGVWLHVDRFVVANCMKQDEKGALTPKSFANM